MKRASIAGLIALAVLQGCASTPSTGTTDKQASVPFLNLRSSLLTWQADGQQGIWVQDMRKQWYYGTMFAPCDGLDFTVVIGIKPRTMNTLDRYSEIIVPDSLRQNCPLRSFTKSAPPPNGKRHQTTDEAKGNAAKGADAT